MNIRNPPSDIADVLTRAKQDGHLTMATVSHDGD